MTLSPIRNNCEKNKKKSFKNSKLTGVEFLLKIFIKGRVEKNKKTAYIKAV